MGTLQLTEEQKAANLRLLAAVERAGPARYEAAGRALASTYYRACWFAQRMLHRSAARIRILVAGRGVGKTHAAAHETLQIVMDSPPNSEGAVLAPTFTHAEACIQKLCEIAFESIPGAEWKDQKKRLMLPGGRSIRVFSADRKESVRGPSLVVLWVDEGALVHVKAINSSMPALRSAIGVETRLIISTTPAGKNWVWKWWEDAATEPGMERLRFRATDSPFQDQFMIERMRKGGMSAEVFAQEYLAEFVDSLILVFPDRDIFIDTAIVRPKSTKCWLGVDIGKDQDWTVLTLLNEWGEGEVLGRWQKGSPGVPSDKFWGETDRRVIHHAQDKGAMVVIDVGGAGGTAGHVMAEKLKGLQIPVLEVKINNPVTKAQMIEQLRADVEWKKLKLLKRPHVCSGMKSPVCPGCWTDQLEYEMSRFQGIKRILHGQEVNIYEGPQLPGEFDDSVISLGLANFGRMHGLDETYDPVAGNFDGFGDLVDGGRMDDAGGSGDLGDWSPLGQIIKWFKEAQRQAA